VQFGSAKRTKVPVSIAKFDLNRCNESPLRGVKPDFWPVSKNNTGSLPLRSNPAGKHMLSEGVTSHVSLLGYLINPESKAPDSPT